MVRRLARALEGRVDVYEVMVDRICVDRAVGATEIDVRWCAVVGACFDLLFFFFNKSSFCCLFVAFFTSFMPFESRA